MDGSEESLATLPTEKLVLTLLQELASRVERLENVDRAQKESGTSSCPNHNSFAQNRLNEELLNTGGAITPQGAYHQWTSEDIPIPAADTLCIHPYGFLLDGDNAGITLKRPSDRLNEVADPEVAKLLRH